MDCILELTADVPDPGEYSGDIIVTGANGAGIVAICPVYIRAVSPSHYMSPSTLSDHFSRQGSEVGPMQHPNPRKNSSFGVDVRLRLRKKSGDGLAFDQTRAASSSKGPLSLVQPLKVRPYFTSIGQMEGRKGDGGSETSL